MRDIPHSILLQHAAAGDAALAAAGAEPVPGGQQAALHPAEGDGAAHDAAELAVRLHEGGGQWGDVDGVPDRLVTR